ncbi:MAG TPA: GNAT family N-acetyltransferase [Kofleriaceae bacterium]|nr:GNAT family N-acetyltransferase [Kofleriaceae bacterium]
MGLAIAESNELAPSVRRAGVADLPALCRLVNRAYAVESFFVDGDRTGLAEVALLAEQGHFLVLDGIGHFSVRDGVEHGRELAASVYLRIEGGRGKLSMLAVAPELQRRGLGHRLVAIVEAMCSAMGCEVVELDIVNLRDELGPFYRRLGYREVGTAPYDHRPSRRECHFVRMQKSL